jgi:hypothetical protein
MDGRCKFLMLGLADMHVHLNVRGPDGILKNEDCATVAVGLRGDLILLEASPLQDVGSVNRRAGVMVCDRWILEPELKARREQLAASCARTGASR